MSCHSRYTRICGRERRTRVVSHALSGHPREHRGVSRPALLRHLVAAEVEELVRRDGRDLAEHGGDGVQAYVPALERTGLEMAAHDPLCLLHCAPPHREPASGASFPSTRSWAAKSTGQDTRGT